MNKEKHFQIQITEKTVCPYGLFYGEMSITHEYYDRDKDSNGKFSCLNSRKILNQSKNV